MKKQNIKHQNARFIDEKLKTKSMMFFVLFCFMRFVRFQILMQTATHLAQASCTELT